MEDKWLESGTNGASSSLVQKGEGFLKGSNRNELNKRDEASYSLERSRPVKNNVQMCLRSIGED